MGDGPRVRIRGIYTTALSALLLEQGATVLEPSLPIQERLGLPYIEGPEEVSIFDRSDRQGVIVEGVSSSVTWVISILREALPDSLFRLYNKKTRVSQGMTGGGLQSLRLALASYVVEFPATVKRRLDYTRSLKVATLHGHHTLKVVDPNAVDAAELELVEHPNQRRPLASQLRQDLVYRHFRHGSSVIIQHVKVDQPLFGRGIELTGRISRCKPGFLLLVRHFRAGGTYDGLGEPKEEGDWGTIILKEGGWVTKRRYFRKGGDLIGDLYNINTPVEFYPDHLRYVDLELDVVRLPDGTARLEDQEVLEERVARGLMPLSLAQAAQGTATRLLSRWSCTGSMA
jgi:hypothetical protein